MAVPGQQGENARACIVVSNYNMIIAIEPVF